MVTQVERRAQTERASQGERLARMEEQVNRLREDVNQLHEDVNKLDTKLDALFDLRNKGAGVFWVASALLGTGFIALFDKLLHYVGWIK